MRTVLAYCAPIESWPHEWSAENWEEQIEKAGGEKSGISIEKFIRGDHSEGYMVVLNQTWSSIEDPEPVGEFCRNGDPGWNRNLKRFMESLELGDCKPGWHVYRTPY